MGASGEGEAGRERDLEALRAARVFVGRGVDMMGEGAWICIDMASVGGARGRPRGSWVSSGGRSQAGDGGTLKLQEVGEHGALWRDNAIQEDGDGRTKELSRKLAKVIRGNTA